MFCCLYGKGNREGGLAALAFRAGQPNSPLHCSKPASIGSTVNPKYRASVHARLNSIPAA
jgi:hypothetical protein